jgi:hypothetical protein
MHSPSARGARMTRPRVWSAVLLSALALPAGIRSEPWAGALLSPASISSHPLPPEPGSPGEVEPGSHLRLGRGVVVDGPVRTPLRLQRSTRDCRRAAPCPDTHCALLERPARLSPVPHSAPECPRFGEAQRDGTWSSRSTGLPPPSV